MAIDFMTMALSRYLSGHFVTPTMRAAWDLGVSYAILGPDGTRVIPVDTFFGGADAAAKHDSFVPMVMADLHTLPEAIALHLWDEASTAEPDVRRVDPQSYDCLLAAAEDRRAGKSVFGFTVRKPGPPMHITAEVFLPVAFDTPFELPVIFERVAGSIPMAIRELETERWADEAAGAHAALLASLRVAERLRVPMIVDA